MCTAKSSWRFYGKLDRKMDINPVLDQHGQNIFQMPIIS